jgi:hypothetical protein
VFGDALELNGPWPLPDLAYWRWRAGLDAPTLPDAEHPFALQIGGDWARAAEAWTAVGCPYEAALALAELGAEPAAARIETQRGPAATS